MTTQEYGLLMGYNAMKNSIRKYYIIAAVLSISGLLIDLLYLLGSGLDVAVWHASQFVFGFLLVFIFGFRNTIWGLSLMLFVDCWLLVEGIVGTRSKFLMLFSFLSAFKILILFPLGVVFGYIYRAIARLLPPLSG